jgi:hypothetical protein
MTSLNALETNLGQVAVAADICLQRDLSIPALVLIYSLVDVMGWAVTPRESNSRTRFEKWLYGYVYPVHPLPCTPLELYAARCAVLHRFSSKADMHSGKNKKLRQIAYAWGPAKLDDLTMVSQFAKLDGRFVGVHINDLLAAVLAGLRKTFEAARTDKELENNLASVTPEQLSHMKKETLQGVANHLAQRRDGS